VQDYKDWCNKNPGKWEYKDRSKCKVFANAPGGVSNLVGAAAGEQMAAQGAKHCRPTCM